MPNSFSYLKLTLHAGGRSSSADAPTVPTSATASVGFAGLPDLLFILHALYLKPSALAVRRNATMKAAVNGSQTVQDPINWHYHGLDIRKCCVPRGKLCVLLNI